MKDKICCCIYYDNEKYKRMAQKAKSSFDFFHPDIDCHLFSDNNLLFRLYEDDRHLYQLSSGLRKMGYIHFLMNYLSYDKVICLGADTITVARLDEFLESNVDIVASLNYPHQFVNNVTGTRSPDDETNLNADVCLFANIKAVEDILSEGVKNYTLWEQAGLNEVVWSDKYDYSYKIVDSPYAESDIIYNVRAKGNINDYDGTKPFFNYIKKWSLENGKILSHDGKHIKVIHYGDGFFTVSADRVNQLVKQWRDSWTDGVKEFIDSLHIGEF